MDFDPAPLPPRQAAALRFIRRYHAENGGMPTVRELMQGLGLSAPHSAAELIDKLVQRGVLYKLPGVSRGLRISEGWAEAERPARFQLPLIGRIAAGKPITASEHVEELLTVDPGLFRPRADWLFRVHGWSMRNLGVFDGDLVGVHEDPDPPSGSVVAAVVPDHGTTDVQLTLKRYQRRAGKVVLLSENDDQAEYPPQVYDAANGDVHIVGRYVGLLRPAGAP